MAYSLIDDDRFHSIRCTSLPILCGAAVTFTLVQLGVPNASSLFITAAAAEEVDPVSMTALPPGMEAASAALKPSLNDQIGGNQRQRMLFVAQLNGEFAVENISGPADKPVPVKVILPKPIDSSYTFLMFRGLPKQFTLSHGFATKDAWAVSLHDVDYLQLIPAPGFEGTFEVEVLLVRGRDVPPERRVMIVEIKQPAAPAIAETSAQLRPSGESVAAGSPQSQRQTSEWNAPAEVQAAVKQPFYGPDATASIKPASEMDDGDREAMARADKLLQSGDIAAARLIFARLAKKGIAAAAFSMARTFDPEFLRSKHTIGLLPDIAQAKYWYEKALELGNKDAAKRLLSLNASGQ